MAEIFLQYQDTLYKYDTKKLKLFQIINDRLIMINDSETLENIRYYSNEIDKEQALNLAQNFNTWFLWCWVFSVVLKSAPIKN